MADSFHSPRCRRASGCHSLNRWLGVGRRCSIDGGPLLRYSRQHLFLAGQSLDRHFIDDDTINPREEPSGSITPTSSVLVHQRFEERLLLVAIVNDPYHAKGDHAAVRHRGIAFEPAVVEDLTGLVDLKADTFVVLD